MRIRLILSFIIVIVITILSMVGIALTNTAREVNSFMLHGGMTGVDEIASSLEDYYTQNASWEGVQTEFYGPGRGLGGMMGQGGMAGMMNQRLALADLSGVILVDTLSRSSGGQLSKLEIDRAIPLYSRGKLVGYLLAEGGASFGPAAQTNLLQRLNSAALIGGAIAFLLSLVLALLLSYSLLRPVRDLQKAARGLEAGDLSQRVPVHGSDELAQLGRGFNQMADSLQHSEESRRAMTADIAHELRNPLAVQRAQLEALQDGIYPLTPENLSPLLEQNLLLTRVVEDLRTLALADAGQLELEKAPVDLRALAERVVERFKPQSEARKVQISTGQSQGLPVLILDSMRIEQILGNLLGNALRYTPEGGEISVGLERVKNKILLTVHDSGPGIPDGTLEQIFERFYRADRSRSRSEGGSGLGLAIARQLARAHGGDLTAANHAQGGAIFTLTLPLV
jgi:two-component system OmpR family sensor kinase/two-component system sensor histidine kinase BaeS